MLVSLYVVRLFAALLLFVDHGHSAAAGGASSSSVSAAATSASTVLEEGWRYRATLGLKLMCPSYEATLPDSVLASIHTTMALKVDSAQAAYKELARSNSGAEKKSEKEKNRTLYCAFRFTPILGSIGVDGNINGLRLGKTVKITNMATDGDVLPKSAMSSDEEGHEYIFASGFFSERKQQPHSLSTYFMGYNFQDSSSEMSLPNLFWRMPLSRISPLPFRLLMRHYMNPGLLAREIRFRYLDGLDKGSFLKIREGVAAKVYSSHLKTVATISPDESGATSSGVAASGGGSASAASAEALPGSQEVGNNPLALSYNCAEQAGLEFLEDRAVGEYLKKIIDITNSEIFGVLIHLHTSETPCHTCATSLARECEKGGLFERLFGGKPIQIVTTTSDHYERRGYPINYYLHTSFLDSLTITRSADGRVVESV